MNVLGSSRAEVGELLTTHPDVDVDVVTFTGSTPSAAASWPPRPTP